MVIIMKPLGKIKKFFAKKKKEHSKNDIYPPPIDGSKKSIHSSEIENDGFYDNVRPKHKKEHSKFDSIIESLSRDATFWDEDKEMGFTNLEPLFEELVKPEFVGLLKGNMGNDESSFSTKNDLKPISSDCNQIDYTE